MKASLLFESQNLRSGEIDISGSKSESNRLVILKAIYPSIEIENLSSSDDTVFLTEGIDRRKGTVNIHHAGTAMRFLTAYFAVQEEAEIILTGSDRMQERPIKILVDALRSLDAEIEYVEKEGYPPLRISGKKLLKSSVSIAANVSSQYISALMLIAPSLDNGLSIELIGKVTSTPYIQMTLSLLNRLGIVGSFQQNKIDIPKSSITSEKQIVVESDWSSASYFYSWIALSENDSVKLKYFKENSLQGDSMLPDIYKSFGISTQFNSEENSVTVTKVKQSSTSILKLDLSNTPDLAQTIVVSCYGIGRGCELTGLHTLKIKETDRLLALESELKKLGAAIEVTNNSLVLSSGSVIKEAVEIATYNDHRMAMAFAPLVRKVPISILDAMVVTKSYPDFWKDLESLGVEISFQ